jgi:hypothetical protein
LKIPHQHSTTQLETHSGTDNNSTDADDARPLFAIRTKALEASARRAAFREREQSEGRATESTFNVRKAQREVGMQSWLRHEWHATGEICEIPILRPDTRTWKNTKWEWRSRESSPCLAGRIATQEIQKETCVCTACRREFVPTRSDAKTCSGACRKKAFRLRKKEAATATGGAR